MDSLPYVPSSSPEALERRQQQYFAAPEMQNQNNHRLDQSDRSADTIPAPDTSQSVNFSQLATPAAEAYQSAKNRPNALLLLMISRQHFLQ